MRAPDSIAALTLLAAALGAVRPGPAPAADSPARAVYRSPLAVAFRPDGRMLAVADHTAGELVLFETSRGAVHGRLRLAGRPEAVAWSPDGRRVFAAEGPAGTVAEADGDGRLLRRIPVGPYPSALAVAGGRLFVADRADGSLRTVDLATGRCGMRLPAARMPRCLAVRPDGRLAVVPASLPRGDAADPRLAASVTLLDPAAGKALAEIALPPNATNLLGAALSPDGRWAYVAGNLARAALPTEQIEYGWINANAVGIIDLPARRLHATILLDRAGNGAANPWSLAVADAGRTLWVSLSGVHQVGRVDLDRLHRRLAPLAGRLRAARAATAADEADGQFVRGAQVYGTGSVDGPRSVEVVASDTPAAYGQGVYINDVFTRFDLPGQGPRGLAVSPDGRYLAVAEYFTGDVAVLSADTGRLLRRLSPGRQPPPDAARRGEMAFHDATRCWEHWLSCATCHPDGRADGLNWDLLNDGIGNPKNTRSLLLATRTAPMMATGVRPDARAAVAAGFRFILFRRPREGDVGDILAWLETLTPAPLPAVRTAAAKVRLGRDLFGSARAGCSACHPPPLFTDRRAYDVGTAAPGDRARRFDTPTLRELWRTAPYLHHGRAVTLRDVLTRFNPHDRHGRTSRLRPDELDALIAYLLSL